MAINAADAFEVREDGVALVDDSGNAVLYITADTGAPAASAPANSMYLDQATQILYFNPTAGNNWRQMRAQDVFFDNTGTDIGATDVQNALANLDRPFGKDFAFQIKETDETTSGGSFTVYDSLTFNVSAPATNRYRLNCDFVWGHNSASNNIRFRTTIDGSTIKELRIEPKYAGTDQRFQNNILTYIDDLSPGNHTFEIEYRPATASRVSRAYRSVLEVWRIS